MDYKFKVYVDDNIEILLFAKIRSKVVAEIDSYGEDYILNVKEEELINFLEQKYLVDIPVIDLGNKSADSCEEFIDAELHPGGFAVHSGGKYKRTVIRFYIPFSGNINILRFKPAKVYTFHSGFELSISKNNIIIPVIDFYGKPENIKKDFDSILNDIVPNYAYLEIECLEFNEHLVSFIKHAIVSRKGKINNNYNLLNSLGVPLRKKDNVSETFSIPSPALRKKIVIEPKEISSTFKPEPTLRDSDYHEILKLINDVGKNLERMPSLYKGKDEENLRDYILFILDPNFQMGSATGETFNKKGKTDILLRYDSSVVFIAECKFWKGEKSLLEAIDQLMGYLTWRDSKTALVIFVKNKEFTSTLDKIQASMPKHNNYVAFINKNDETWLNYTFHLNGDQEREVKLSVLVFHLPN